MAALEFLGPAGFTVKNVSFFGFHESLRVEGAVNGHIDNVRITAARPRKKNAKVGRNDPCPCDSGFKYKKCCSTKGESMSIGIRSIDSRLVVGKANIVADVGIDLIRSDAKVDELNHVSPTAPDLDSVLKSMVVRPPEDLIQSAIEQAKNEGTTEGLSYTKLKQWCDKQGVNAAMWLQLAAAIGTTVFGR
ncbi:SEC-C metal-binding domain-containing protein [Pseudomonas protegens]|uniref:SEC-C metal-binding domain-containing protein n=1 Tax=Pseudomonas protegens TaxID=380021 RepID=UPI001B32D888|nr:SEC-C metal-binding domain-containing protein [Pseudomonas protegens]